MRRHGGYTATVRAVLEKGGDGCRDNAGRTALMEAASGLHGYGSSPALEKGAKAECHRHRMDALVLGPPFLAGSDTIRLAAGKGRDVNAKNKLRNNAFDPCRLEANMDTVAVPARIPCRRNVQRTTWERQT